MEAIAAAMATWFARLRRPAADETSTTELPVVITRAAARTAA